MPDRLWQILKYVVLVGLTAVVAGFLIGAILGAVMTWYNNNMLIDTAQGSYAFWAKFIGLYGAATALPVGLLVGFLIGLSRTSPVERA